MCGRYVIAYDPQTLVSGFSLTRVQPFERRWNVAPQSAVPVVYETRTGERVAETMRWGLVPHWARDPALGAKLNNARAEGLADKPAFRQALRRRRCILPASGFYEWQAATGADGKPYRQPWYFSPGDAAPLLAMAGLFEAWRPADVGAESEWLLTCCVITTAADATVAAVHERMPLLLAPGQWAAWLDRRQTDPAALAPLQAAGAAPGAAAAVALQAWPVGRAVGRSSAEGEALTAPLPGSAPAG